MALKEKQPEHQPLPEPRELAGGRKLTLAMRYAGLGLATAATAVAAVTATSIGVGLGIFAVGAVPGVALLIASEIREGKEKRL